MGRLVIKFPTRNRPERFTRKFDRYVSLLSGRHQVRFVVSLDEDDDTMNTEVMRAWFDSRKCAVDLKYSYGHSRNKIEAINCDMEGEDGDVLLVASDDMYPVRRHYDAVIFTAFERAFPDFDGAIKFWDGQRRPIDPLMTLAVLGFPLYRKFGYIYHPDYTSVYADNEQSQVCALVGRFAMSRTCIIRHDWTHEPFDTLHARNDDPGMYATDRAVYEARQARGFDIQQTFGPASRRSKVPTAKWVDVESGIAGVWHRLTGGVGR